MRDWWINRENNDFWLPLEKGRGWKKCVFCSSYNVEVELYTRRIKLVVLVYWLFPPTTTETHL